MLTQDERIFLRSADGRFVIVRMPSQRGGDSEATFAAGLDQADAISGHHFDSRDDERKGRARGFIRDAGGDVISFAVPDMVGTYPASINDMGVVCRLLCRFQAPAARLHPLSLTARWAPASSASGDVTVFQMQSTSSTMATDINDGGVIVGVARDRRNRNHDSSAVRST